MSWQEQGYVPPDSIHQEVSNAERASVIADMKERIETSAIVEDETEPTT